MACEMRHLAFSLIRRASWNCDEIIHSNDISIEANLFMVKVTIKVMQEENMEKSLETTQQDLFSSFPLIKIYAEVNSFSHSKHLSLGCHAICQMREFHSRIATISAN